MSDQRKGSLFIRIVIVTIFIGVVAGMTAILAYLPPPADDDGAYRAVRALGFKDPTIIARHGGQVAAWQQGCDEGQMSACDMRATDGSGRIVTLLVCCGGAANRSCSVRAK